VDLPYARQLGLLAETLGRPDDAIAHLEDAEARTARAGLRAHLARLRYELARTLCARGARGDRQRALELLSQARALATELGQPGLLARIAVLGVEDAQVTASAEPHLSMRRKGDHWAVTWGDRTVHLRDSRGLALLEQLVDNAGRELHVLQLVSPGEEPPDLGDAGPALDDEAVHSYRQRLLDLRDELDEAERYADTARAEKARAEIDFLEIELSRAVGLGGRTRRVGQPAERARTAVTKRLREAIRRIEEELPQLGAHLSQSIRTGAFCSYRPDGRLRSKR
jgi:tetratricopeptide (TPR) repeat protein